MSGFRPTCNPYHSFHSLSFFCGTGFIMVLCTANATFHVWRGGAGKYCRALESADWRAQTGERRLESADWRVLESTGEYWRAQTGEYWRVLELTGESTGERRLRSTRERRLESTGAYRRECWRAQTGKYWRVLESADWRVLESADW